MDKATQMSAKQLMKHAENGTVPDGAILIVNEDATLTKVEPFEPQPMVITNPYANLPEIVSVKGQFKKKRKHNNRKKKRRK